MSPDPVDNYRRDVRTAKEFARNIAESSQIERDIINRFALRFEQVHGRKPVIEDNGCGNDGRLLKSSEVTMAADYLLNGEPLEVKYNRQVLRRFRFKAEQLKSYIEQGARVLWVNGYCTNRPVFMVLSIETLKEIQVNKDPIPFLPWGGKLCYELEADEFGWNCLDKQQTERRGHHG